LNDHIAPEKVGRIDIRLHPPEFGDGGNHFGPVLLGRLDQDIDILRVARLGVIRIGVTPDDQIFSLFCAE